MRIAAASLAAATSMFQLLVFAISETQREVPVVTGMVGTPWWGRALWAVGWALPWAVGAAVLVWARPRFGTAVVVPLAALSLPDVVGVLRLLVTIGEVAATGTAWMAAVAQAVAWALGIAAGVTAWLARWRGAWREGAPGPGGLFTTAAIAAWLPTAFRSTAFAPPGAPRRFVEPLATELDVASSPLFVYPLLVAVLLIVAPRLTEAVAGVVTLTFAVPQFVSHAATVRAAIEQDLMIPTPSGVLGLIGVAVLVVLGTVWLVRGRREISGGATDPGRVPVA